MGSARAADLRKNVATTDNWMLSSVPMKRTIAAAAAILLSTVTAASADTPTQKDLEAHAKELQTKLKGQGYTILVEAPFVVIGDSPAATVKKITTGFLRGKVALLEKEFFTKRPDRVLEVWLFGNEKSFR